MEYPSVSNPPKLAKRREHKKSSFQAGRTIGEKREKLETRNERNAARRKDKKKKILRITLTIAGFLVIIGVIVLLFLTFTKASREIQAETEEVEYRPTIEIVDENAASGGITSRMREFIGQVEADLKEYDIKATKAVIPNGAIREVRFYLEGYNGYVKMLIDRGAGVSTEDTSRMLKYLAETGVDDFEYIDVRIEGKAYWK